MVAEVVDLCGLPMPKVTEVLAVRGVATLSRLVDTMAEVPLVAGATNQGVVMLELTGQPILMDVVTAAAAVVDAKVALLEQVAPGGFRGCPGGGGGGGGGNDGSGNSGVGGAGGNGIVRMWFY